MVVAQGKVKKVFRSRISVLTIVCLSAFFLLTSLMLEEHHGFFLLGGLVFIILLLGGVRYIIKDGKIYEKVWFIPTGSLIIANIISIKRAYNTLPAGAASFKRLHLTMDFGCRYPFVFISPVREQEFIMELTTVNPKILVDVPDQKEWRNIHDWNI